MPKNTIIPAAGGPGPAPPVPEQGIRFDRTRATNLRGYTPGGDESDQWVMSWWQKVVGDLGVNRVVWEARIDANNFSRFEVDATNRLIFRANIAGVQEAFVGMQRNYVDVSNWHHIHLSFNRTGGFLQLSFQGYGSPTIQQIPVTTIANIPGYAWLSGTEHFIASDGLDADHFSAYINEMHCVGGGSLPARTAFGTFNSKGVWERIAYAGGHGSRGFYLSFGRTVDLGEDFSGNANDFTVHTNGGSSDQVDDWMERNYCILDVKDHRSTGTIDDGALDVSGGNAAVTMRPEFGEWYYEVDGVGIVWDTGVSGPFDPIIAGPASVNFGQLPFVDVGPSGGELTVNSNNFPATDTDIARNYVGVIEWNGEATNPRDILTGQGQSTVYDIEYADLLGRSDLVWAKKAGPAGTNWYQAHRLRPAAQLPINTGGAEETVNANGVITELLDPGPGFEVTDGATDNDNFNEFGNKYNCLALTVLRYAQNIQVTTNDESDAEEIVSSGSCDTGSSDLELGSEDGGSGSAEQIVGMQWKNVRIPQGATINEAFVQFMVDAPRNDQPNDLEIWAEDIDDAPEFTDTDDDISDRTRTSASVLWSPPEWTSAQDRDADQRTPDIAVPIKEVVDRGGWAIGNDMAVIIQNESGGTVGRHEAEAGNAGTPAEAVGPMLQVAWQEGTVDNGLSLFTYDGVGTIAQVMHGLDEVPEFYAIKRLDSGENWRCYHEGIELALPAPEDGYLSLNLTSAAVDSQLTWNDTPPDSTFLTVSTTDPVNAQGGEYAGMAMRSIDGFSKAFRYIGNGSADGPEIYLGFKPRFILIKRTQVASNWVSMMKVTDIIAAQNNQFNLMDSMGFLNTTDNMFNNIGMHAQANGFKVVDTDAAVNVNAAEYVGIAFAEAGFPVNKASY